MSVPEFLEETELYRSHLVRAPEYPAIIQMELTTDCNLRCIMCPLSSEQRSLAPEERMFSLDELKQFEQAIRHADELELTGFGEDLYHPQALNILRWFRSLGVGINLTTNGQLLTPELSETIVAERLCDVICFSIDAASGHTYRRIRRGGTWKRLLAHLEALANARDRLASDIPTIYLSFCAMKKNIAELPEFVRMAKRFGASKVIVQHVFENRFTAGQNLINHPELAARYIPEAQTVADELGIALDVTNISPADTDEVQWAERALIFSPKLFRERNRLVKDCEFPWVRCFVRPDRTVQACAITWIGLILGNLYKRSFEEIWRGEVYRDFRLKMGTFDTPDECVICMYRGWRKPVVIDEMAGEVGCGPKERQLGVGWHAPERDREGRWCRWTRREASIFLKNADLCICELELYRHPDAPEIGGSVVVNDGFEFRFSHHDLWGRPLAVPVPASCGGLLRIDIRLDGLWRPNEIGIYGSRRIGLLFYGARLKTKADKLKPVVRVADAVDSEQLGFGWLLPERRGLKLVRWTQERAYIVLRRRGNAISVWGYTPRGLEPRVVEMRVDGMPVGRHTFENTKGPKRYAYRLDACATSKAPYSVVELHALNAKSVPSSAERPLGILVHKIGFC